MTRSEIIQKLAHKKSIAMINSGSWGDVVAGVQAMDVASRQRLLVDIKRGDHSGVGNSIIRVYRDYVKSQATIAVESELSDDSLSLTELEHYL